MEHIKEDSFHLGTKLLVYNEEGKLLLLKLKKPSGAWDLPGGRMQKNESLEETLRREVEEEIGLKELPGLTFLFMTLTQRRIVFPSTDVGLILAIYQCEMPSTFAISLSDEHTHFEWVYPQEAAKLLTVAFPPELTDRLATV